VIRFDFQFSAGGPADEFGQGLTDAADVLIKPVAADRDAAKDEAEEPLRP